MLSRLQRNLEGCDRWGEGRGILYFEASVVQWKDLRHWRLAGRVWAWSKTFCFWKKLISIFLGEQESCDGRGGPRSAPFGVLMGPKRRVRARGLQFYTFFGISIGIKRRLIDIAKKITFYFLQNVWKCTVFFAFAFKVCKKCYYDPKKFFLEKY